MTANLLDDIRKELEGDLNHPIISGPLICLSAGFGVIATGELLSGLGASELLIFLGMAIASAASPTVSYYVLRKLGC
jgi:hypothetical protein